jgi:hypothetical protein
MDLQAPPVTQETTFSFLPLAKLSEVTQNFWRDLLGGVLGPQLGSPNGAPGPSPEVGDRPWS